MSDHNNIYNIMGKLNALTPVEETPKEAAQRIYESVEARGSVLAGVKSVQAKLEAKLAEHKQDVAEAKGKLTYTPTSTSHAVVPDGKKEFVKKFKSKDEASAHAAKHGGKVVTLDQHGRRMKADVAEEETQLDEINMDVLNHLASHPAAGPLAAAGGAAIGAAVGKGIKKLAGAHKYFGSNQKKPADGKMAEVSPPGAKAERMVKGIKKSLSKDGHLSNKDKSIAYATAWKAHNKGKVEEGKTMFGKALMESVNFKKMMDECGMTMEEMLEGINQDIQAYKATGDMSNRLRDFMHLHNHMKKIEEESMAPQMPSGQDILPKQSTLGKIGSTVKKAFTVPSDDELLAQLQQDTQPTTVDEELNELAKLAGITDEGNAFTGKLASTPKGGQFELDGETYTDTSNVDEDEAGPVQMYQESKKTNLEDIARLSGIYQEGKDYGDTTYNEPPTYDNTPDECVQGEEVLLKGGDGEVAGQEKKMTKNGSARFSDNPMATESKELIKPAKEFNYVKEMGRDLMKAYESIKSK